jgi:hypothetical protein
MRILASLGLSGIQVHFRVWTQFSGALADICPSRIFVGVHAPYPAGPRRNIRTEGLRWYPSHGDRCGVAVLTPQLIRSKRPAAA